MTAPLVLLVEDHQDTLERRQRLFQGAEYNVIPASTAEEAIRQVWSSPLISLVYTDIDLDADPERRDTSGIDLMKYLKEVRPGLPIVGYSGVFEPGQISTQDLMGFDRYHPRGSMSVPEMETELEDLRGLALSYTSKRAQEAEARLLDLQTRLSIDADVFHGYRALLPNKVYELEQTLASSGYEALVAYPYGQSRAGTELSADDVRATLRVPLVVWLREDGGIFESEVLGMPQLYAAGDSQDDAIDKVLQLMVLFAMDLRGPEPVAGVAEELQTFLSNVIHLHELS